MSVLEVAINRLLKNKRVEFFSLHTTYKQQIHDNPQAAEYLLSLLSEDGYLAPRAAQMLSLFSHHGLLKVSEKMKDPDTQWRTWLLIIASSILMNIQADNEAVEDNDIFIYVSVLLTDTSFVNNLNPEDTPIEVEYEETRVCDEAYILLRFMHDAQFNDEAQFYDLSISERDFEIQTYQPILMKRRGNIGLV